MAISDGTVIVPSPTSALLGTPRFLLNKSSWQKCQQELLCLFCVKLSWMSACKLLKSRLRNFTDLCLVIILMCNGICVILKQESKLHAYKEYWK